MHGVFSSETIRKQSSWSCTLMRSWYVLLIILSYKANTLQDDKFNKSLLMKARREWKLIYKRSVEVDVQPEFKELIKKSLQVPYPG